MRKLLLTLALALVVMAPISLRAQTEIDLWGQMGKGQVEGEKIAFRGGGSFIAHAGNLILGINLSDGLSTDDWAYGLTAGLDLGSWSLAPLAGLWGGFAPATLGLELYGQTDVSDESFAFSKGSLGIGILPDFKPGNRLKTCVKVLYHGEPGFKPEVRVQVGARIGVGG